MVLLDWVRRGLAVKIREAVRAVYLRRADMEMMRKRR